MNHRPTGNASKSMVMPFGFCWTNGCASELYWKKPTLDLKTCHFMELLLSLGQ